MFGMLVEQDDLGSGQGGNGVGGEFYQVPWEGGGGFGDERGGLVASSSSFCFGVRVCVVVIVVVGCSRAKILRVSVKRAHDVAAFVNRVDARAADRVEVLFVSHA